jgi:trimeric autotransporter adhesin
MFNVPSFFGFRSGSYGIPFVGLLDTYGGTAAAYSLRGLSTPYVTGGTPYACQVRNSSNATADIGFVYNPLTGEYDLDIAALLAHCGGGDGFVTEWYDQSGNGRDATQGVALNQPQIVSSGSVLNVNGKPSLLFDGSNDEFSLSSTITTSIYSNFVVLKKTGTGTIVIPSGLANGQLTGAWSDGNLYENNGSTFVSVPYTNNTNQNLFSIIKNGNTLSDFSATQNASTLGSYTGTSFTSITTDRLGARSGTYSDGNLQEIVLYSSNQSSNRTGIETNINDFYSIY